MDDFEALVARSEEIGIDRLGWELYEQDKAERDAKLDRLLELAADGADAAVERREP